MIQVYLWSDTTTLNHNKRGSSLECVDKSDSGEVEGRRRVANTIQSLQEINVSGLSNDKSVLFRSPFSQSYLPTCNTRPNDP